MPTKDEIRKIVAERKQSAGDTREMSRQVMARLMTLPEMETADVIMTYVDFGKEVQTLPLISDLLKLGKRVVVPYCDKNEIQLFQIKELSELAPGSYGILEPKIELRYHSDHHVRSDELRLILVPCVAFDHLCGRVGRGKGYYDRFLKKTPENTLIIGLAFDFQQFDRVPMSGTDHFLDIIVTEKQVFFRDLRHE